MDAKIKFVLDTMRMTVMENEGAVVEYVGLENGVLKVHYIEGTNPECADCVLPPDSFKQLLMESLKVQAPYIRDVELV